MTKGIKGVQLCSKKPLLSVIEHINYHANPEKGVHTIELMIMR